MAKLGVNHGDTLKVADSKLDVADSIKNGAAAGATALQSVSAPLTKSGTSVGIPYAGDGIVGASAFYGEIEIDANAIGVAHYKSDEHIGVIGIVGEGISKVPKNSSGVGGDAISLDFSVVAKKSDIPSITTELELAEPLYWVE